MTDQTLMRECLRLARRGVGGVSPNPLVGAILARDGRVLSRGYHRHWGGPHAEVECLARYRGSLRGSTLYVNLEPCSHYGKTPPCARAIIDAGVPEVVVAMRDPNPLVSGAGIRMLRRAGVRVRTGILEAEAREVNRVFVHHITKGRPFVHLKVAQSLDGYIAPRGGSRYWITGKESRTLVHRWRAESDAILVGAATIAADDPRLDVRWVKGRNPAVVVLDGRFSISPRARIFRGGARVLILAGSQALAEKEQKHRSIAQSGGVVLGLPTRNGRIPVATILRTLYRHNFASILVEGGADVFSQFGRSGMVDRLSVFIAPILLGDGVPAFAPGQARVPRYQRRIRLAARNIGDDMLVESYAE